MLLLLQLLLIRQLRIVALLNFLSSTLERHDPDVIVFAEYLGLLLRRPRLLRDALALVVEEPVRVTDPGHPPHEHTTGW